LSTGIVIAGFGDDEKFPSLIAYDLDGVIAGSIKKKQRSYIDVSREMRGAILPFAQQDMVVRFMEGADPSHMEYLHGKMINLFISNSMSIVDAHVAGTKAEKDAIKRTITGA
jgi:hypothetical protein